jgi:hypothetical protein
MQDSTKSAAAVVTVKNSTQGVTWSTTGGIGTIDRNGIFSAGATPGTGTVTATSVGDPTKTASAQVSVSAATCVPAKAHPPHDD